MTLRRNFTGFGLLAGCAALVLCQAAQAQENGKSVYNIPAQSLDSALTQFGMQSGRQLVFDPDVIPSMTTQSVQGEYTTLKALEILLSNSGLTYAIDGKDTIIVRRINSASVDHGIHLAQAGDPAAARALPEEPAAAEEPQTITIVGSSIRSSQDYLANSRPIQVVTAGQFEKTAGENIGEFLLKLPVNTGANLTPATDEYGGGSTNINLRGLGAKYTLVLVDGRRFGGENYSPDIGALPAEAVESVEILKGGASAVYGSDAVAGVVNIRLKRNFTGIELYSSYGETTRGDAGLFRTAALFGVQDERFSFMGSVSYQDRGGFTKYDRKLTASRDYRPYGGIDRRSTAVGTPHQIVLDSDPDTVLSIDVSRFASGYYGGSLSDYVPYDHEAQAFSSNEIGTYPEQDQLAGHWSAEYRLIDDRLSFFTNGYLSHRKQEFLIAQSRPDLVVPASNPYNPFGETVSVNYLLGGAEIDPWKGNYDTMNFQGTAGLQGRAGRFNYEVAYSSHRRRIDETYSNDIDFDAIQAAVERTDTLAFNPFGYNANSPEQMALITLPEYGADRIDRNRSLNARLDGKLFDWYAGEALFAVGFEHRNIDYQLDPTLIAQTRSTSYPSISEPVSRSRSVDGWFGEVRLPVYDAADSAAVIRSAEVTAAVRHEKYSDFGSSTVWQSAGKIGFLDDSWMLRASYAESFKAPSVAALVSPASAFENDNFYYDPVRGGVFAVGLIAGGNPDLTPEMGKSVNVGLVARPRTLPNATFTLDYWTVKLSDVIGQPDAQALLFGTSLSGSITRDPLTQYPTIDIRLDNGGERNVAGVDVGGGYRWDTQARGSLSFDLNLTRLTRFEDVANDGRRIDNLGLFSNNPGVMPKMRAVLSIGWQHRGFDLNGTLHHMSGYGDVLPGVIDRRVSSYDTVDLQAAYEFGDAGRLSGLRIYGGLENAFDTALPFVASSSDGWDRALADYRGRYWYFGLKKKL